MYIYVYIDLFIYFTCEGLETQKYLDADTILHAQSRYS